MPLPVLPMALKLTREALLGQSSVAGLVGGRIYWSLPAVPTYPLIQLILVDTNEDGPAAQLARIQANCWGAGPTTTDLEGCVLLVNTLVAAHRDLIGPWPAGDIAGAATGAVISSPDPKTGRVRLHVDLLLTIYP